jgi:hypothetical protein
MNDEPALQLTNAELLLRHRQASYPDIYCRDETEEDKKDTPE